MSYTVFLFVDDDGNDDNDDDNDYDGVVAVGLV